MLRPVASPPGTELTEADLAKASRVLAEAASRALALARKQNSPDKTWRALDMVINLEREHPGTLIANAHLRQDVVRCAFAVKDGLFTATHPLSNAGPFATLGGFAGKW